MRAAARTATPPGVGQRRGAIRAASRGLVWLAVCLNASGSAVLAEEPPEPIVLDEIVWGFDGTAPAQTFVPLSLLVRNAAPEPFRGTMTLQHTGGVAMRRPLFLSGLSSQWVQFTPYVADDWDEWMLVWGPGRAQRADLPTPRTGGPATVLLFDPDEPQSAAGEIRRLAENLFPPSVTATDSLRGVVLDHIPDWQGARRQSFIDWLRRGGRVYLLHDRNGSFPKLPADWARLNPSEERTRVGSGEVRRLPMAVSDLTAAFVRTHLAGEPPRSRTDALPSSDSSLNGRQIPPLAAWDRDETILYALEHLARYDRRWWLIYLLAIGYVAAMFPGCYRLGRSIPDYRLFYAAYIGIAAVFAVGFTYLARVGGSDTNRVRTVAIAHEFADGLFDVTQWSTVAAISSGMYDLRHAGSGRAYATLQRFETVNGAVESDPEIHLELEIPPTSTRTLVHRARCEAPGLGLRVTSYRAEGGQLLDFSFEGGAGYPRHVEGVFASDGVRIYEMDVLPSGARSTRRSEELREYLDGIHDVLDWSKKYRAAEEFETTSHDALFRSLLRPLIGNSLALKGTQLGSRPQIADRMRVYILARMSDLYFVQGAEFPDQQGYVLYIADLPVRGEQ